MDAGGRFTAGGTCFHGRLPFSDKSGEIQAGGRMKSRGHGIEKVALASLAHRRKNRGPAWRRGIAGRPRRHAGPQVWRARSRRARVTCPYPPPRVRRIPRAQRIGGKAGGHSRARLRQMSGLCCDGRWRAQRLHPPEREAVKNPGILFQIRAAIAFHDQRLAHDPSTQERLIEPSASSD